MAWSHAPHIPRSSHPHLPQHPASFLGYQLNSSKKEHLLIIPGDIVLGFSLSLGLLLSD